MRREENTKRRRRQRSLYRSAKISDYQFRKVLWHFTLDHSAAEAAKNMKLSANSISAIYQKLRHFFFDYGLFSDPYRGRDPRLPMFDDGNEDVELHILDFHLKRASAKRGQVDTTMDLPDYHLAESCWRMHFLPLQEERGESSTHRVKYARLLEFVRRFGPVNEQHAPTKAQKIAGRELALEQFDRTLRWLERNAAKYRSSEKRGALARLRYDD